MASPELPFAPSGATSLAPGWQEKLSGLMLAAALPAVGFMSGCQVALGNTLHPHKHAAHPPERSVHHASLKAQRTFHRMPHFGVDFAFISVSEGKQVTRGYVVSDKQADGRMAFDGTGGVIIATGFDLGPQDRDAIQAMPISEALKHKLFPYTGLTGEKAYDALRANPLTVTRAEAGAIDRAERAHLIGQLREAFNHDVDTHNAHTRGRKSRHFERLPTGVQTALADLYWQYGALNQPGGAPKVWHAYVREDYQGVQRELEHFGDEYPGRRVREARLIGKLADNPSSHGR